MNQKFKILGGPGCGKTYALMGKYQEFLNLDYDPTQITLITFRKTSAIDLINSVSQKVKTPKKTLKQHVGTIHSICARLGGYKDVLTQSDYADFIVKYKYTQFTKFTTNQDEDEDSTYSGDLFNLYSWLRNTCTEPTKWLKYPGASKISLPSERVPEFLANYEKYKKEVNKIDYSDMLQYVIDNEIDLDTPILMIDEFQDLTAQMNKLFKMWEEKRDAVVIAGDPFQSIYGYMGGSPDYFTQWQAEEVILNKTHRLPEQIKQFGRKILKFGGMTAPDPEGKQGYINPVVPMQYGKDLPQHKTELHLVRCKYQFGAVAMDLAIHGKVFIANKGFGWTDDDIKIANAILTYRAGKLLSQDQLITIIKAYPAKIYGKSSTHEEICKMIEKQYTPNIRENTKLLKPVILDSMLSDDPVLKMSSNSKLFSARIKGILGRKKLIKPIEALNRRIMTIHGSKGLEADAVFLHTAITDRIFKTTVVQGKEYSAEARVWYVGATRARETLYLITDIGKNWKMPGVTV